MLRDVAAGDGGDRADPPAVERPLRRRLRANGAGTSRWGRDMASALARRCPARRLRQLLPPALGPAAARRLADPASGARPGRALSRQLPRRPRLVRRRLVRDRGRDDGLGQPRGRHRVPPRRPAQPRRPDARPGADLVVRGVAGRRPRRRSPSGVPEPVRQRRVAGRPPGAGVRAQAPPGHRQGRARGPLHRRGRAGVDGPAAAGRPAALARPQPRRQPSARRVRRAAGRARGRRERAARHRPRPGRGVRRPAADPARRPGPRHLLHRRRRQPLDAARGDRQVPAARATSSAPR